MPHEKYQNDDDTGAYSYIHWYFNKGETSGNVAETHVLLVSNVVVDTNRWVCRIVAVGEHGVALPVARREDEAEKKNDNDLETTTAHATLPCQFFTC